MISAEKLEKVVSPPQNPGMMSRRHSGERSAQLEKKAMARPMIHHRAPEFDKIFAEVREDLKWLFQTRNDVLILAASGTGGMEGSVSNFLSPGDKALTINGGKFGERWTKLCKAFGAQVTELKVEWGRAVDPQAVADALKKDPSIKAVYVQASETSTAVAHDVKALADIV